MDAEMLAVDTEWKTGDRAVARAMAMAYSGAHPEMRAKYGGLDIPQLVALVDQARERGDEDERISLDVWLLAEFQPQVIGGSIDISGTRNT